MSQTITATTQATPAAQTAQPTAHPSFPDKVMLIKAELDPDTEQTTNLYGFTDHQIKIETVKLSDSMIHRHYNQVGKWLVRKAPDPERPYSVDNWHGPYDTEEAGIQAFIDATALPEVTPKELAYYKKNDYWGKCDDGIERIVVMDKWSGGTILSPFILTHDHQKNT